MKFKIVFVFAALILVSCGKLGDKTGNALDIKGDQKSRGAGNVIAYNNAMVTFMNEADSKMDRVANEYTAIYKMVTNKKKPIVYTGLAFTGSNPNLKDRSSGISLLEASDYLPAEVSSKIKESIKNANDAYNSTKDVYDKLKSYVRNEDFKDDNWTKGVKLTEIIKDNVSKFYENQELAYKIIKPFADEAEVKLLENHPLRESILASKMDLNLAKELLNLIYTEEFDINKLTVKYDELEANFTEHKDLTPNLLKEHNKANQYNNFYKEIEEFLGEVRKSKRDGKISKREADSIGRGYDALIIYYNSFV